MRVRARQLPALVAAPVLVLAAAACSSSPASPGPTAATTQAAAFPVTITSFRLSSARPGPARRDHLALAYGHRDALRDRRRRPGHRAVDDDSDYPASAPITKLSGYTPNAEAIAAYKPDLVVISNNISGITAKLESLSVPVLTLPAAVNLQQEYAEFDQLGQATGHLPQAQQEVTKLKAEVSKIVAAEPKRTTPLTYYYEVSTDPYYSATSSTFIGSVLSLLGLKSVADAAKGAAAAGGYPTLSSEFILKSNPDYIILTDTGPTAGGQSAATVSRRPGWSVLTAVKDKHIISLNADVASRWGPRIVDMLQDVAKALTQGSQ